MLNRILPAEISDPQCLAMLLYQLLQVLQNGLAQKPLRQLSYETWVSEKVYVYLSEAPQQDLYVHNIGVVDYHFVLERLMLHHPTLKIWQTDTGELFFEM
jgi:hypothetical protein